MGYCICCGAENINDKHNHDPECIWYGGEDQMSYKEQMEYTVYYLKTDRGPVDDRTFDTVEEADKAKNELLQKVPGVYLNENLTVATQTVQKRLLTE